MNKKLEKIELLNKQNELSLSRLDKPDIKNLKIDYIKGKIIYNLLDRVSIEYENFYTIQIYNFPELLIPDIRVVSYFDAENAYYKYIIENKTGNFIGYESHSFRLIDDGVHEIKIKILGYLYDDSNNRLPLYNTTFLQINKCE